MPKCEVCGQEKPEEETVVVCVPACPVSCCYCKTCLEANAHPWGILVANTAIIGWVHCAGWWQEMVHATCRHLGKSHEEFLADVAEATREMDEEFARQVEDWSRPAEE